MGWGVCFRVSLFGLHSRVFLKFSQNCREMTALSSCCEALYPVQLCHLFGNFFFLCILYRFISLYLSYFSVYHFYHELKFCYKVLPPSFGRFLFLIVFILFCLIYVLVIFQFIIFIMNYSLAKIHRL